MAIVVNLIGFTSLRRHISGGVGEGGLAEEGRSYCEGRWYYPIVHGPQNE